MLAFHERSYSPIPTTASGGLTFNPLPCTVDWIADTFYR